MFVYTKQKISLSFILTSLIFVTPPKVIDGHVPQHTSGRSALGHLEKSPPPRLLCIHAVLLGRHLSFAVSHLFLLQVIAVDLAFILFVEAGQRLSVLVDAPAVTSFAAFGWLTLFFLVETPLVAVWNAEASWVQHV